ncbi:MAG: gliding motility-associated C-terminal domain-containing protein [Saprospiraceae bacterium]|nr:gliding motility-associated C-terminal domain-containing protein [Saprospiraceae bacterium]
MKTSNHVFFPKRIPALVFLLLGLLGPSLGRAQACFSINTSKSRLELSPSLSVQLPDEGDTLKIPCTRRIENLSIVLDFQSNTEKYFEDSTQLVATLLQNGFTYVLVYDKAANTFKIPSNQPDLDAGSYSLTISSAACAPFGVVCGNCIPTYTFFIVFSQAQVNLTIQTNPSPPILKCVPGNVVTLTGSPLPHDKFSAQWFKFTNNLFVPIPGATSTEYKANLAGVYQYKITGPVGCTGAELATVNPPQMPILSIAPNPQTLEACTQAITGVSVENFGTSVSNLSYAWTALNGGDIQSGANTSSPVVRSAGVYSLVVTRNDNSCAAVGQLKMEAGAIPLLSVKIISSGGNIQLDCLTKEIQLNAVAELSSGAPQFTYAWSEGSSSSSIVVNTPGTYNVTVTATDIGCQRSSSTQISQLMTLPALQITSSKDTVCPNQSVTLTASTNIPTPAYKWNDNSGNKTQVVYPTNLGPNTYGVTITDLQSGCTNAGSKIIVLEPTPFVACNAFSQTIYDGDPLSLDCQASNGLLIWASNVVNVSGVPPSGEGAIQDQPYGLFDDRAPGMVQFYLYSQNPGCTSDRVEVNVQILPDADQNIYIPELITPNGDGLNDSWNIILPGGASPPENYLLSVFNRYGSQVFTGNLSVLFNADDYPDGSYYYILTPPDGQTIRGAVTILRRQ